MTLVQTMNIVLSSLTVLGQVFILLWLCANVFFKKAPLSEMFREKERAWAMKGAFLVALFATLGSLFYSEIAHYTPCLLCWYQRIFKYPQVFLLGLGLVKRDKNIADYSLLLSVIGGILAAYHYLLQLGIAPEL